MRNPPWSRDELIVTLDFYLRHAPSIPGKSSSEVSDLSTFLGQLQSKMGGVIPEKFRNRNGVYMKLMNFRRLDPTYDGKGLERGNKDEEAVWDLYYSRRDELRKVADAIRSFVSLDEVPSTESTADYYEGEEGRVLTRIHRYRERDTGLVRRKKEITMKECGTLVCEVCDFNFESVYGDRGRGFMECHHRKPLSELSLSGELTTIADLSLICPNCHRMIHKSRPWLSIEELRELVRSA